MNYIEQNVHTGEKRQHTEASLRLRLLAINVPNMPATGLPKLPLDTVHSWFRQQCLRDQPARPARETGAWGLDTVAQTCPICHGTGRLQYKTADTSEQGDCWKCNGKGTVQVPV
jgi:hypothetical protein